MKSPHPSPKFAYKLLAAGIACLAFALGGMAQDTSQKKTTYGPISSQVQVDRAEVVYVAGNDLVVKMESGEIRHFVVPDSRKITVEGRELSVHDLKPGMKLQRVIVTTTTPKLVTTVRTIQGKVWQLNAPSSVILQLGDGTNKQYKVPKGQKFMIDGEEKSVFDLRKGMTVTATVITQVPETRISEERRVIGQMPPPPATPPMEGALLIEEPAPSAPEKPVAAPVEKAAAAPAPRLPKTGSPLPLVGLLGSLLLAAALGLRMIRMRTQE